MTTKNGEYEKWRQLINMAARLQDHKGVNCAIFIHNETFSKEGLRFFRQRINKDVDDKVPKGSRQKCEQPCNQSSVMHFRLRICKLPFSFH